MRNCHKLYTALKHQGFGVYVTGKSPTAEQDVTKWVIVDPYCAQSLVMNVRYVYKHEQTMHHNYLPRDHGAARYKVSH